MSTETILLGALAKLPEARQKLMHSEACALRDEIYRLQRIEHAARCYYRCYMRDEATDPLVCTRDQHEAAAEVRNALGER